jgi:hypothetical protein
MAALYSDENFPQPVVAILRQLGHDVLTIQADGKANLRYSDEAVLRDASAYGRAVLTINRKDFRRIHQQNPDHSGIISCTYDPDFIGQARRIHDKISSISTLNGQLILIYRQINAGA